MLDDLKIRYKESKLPIRLGLCALVAIIPAVLLYTDESAIVDAEYANAESQEKAAAQKIVQAENTLKDLPKAESELAFTRDQLKKAETRLPDNVAVDEVLRSIGKSSKTFGVNVVLFEPGSEVVRGDSYKYAELPLKISVEGNDYGQICEWLDDVAGGKSKMYLKSWKITRKSGANRDGDAAFSRVVGMQGQIFSASQLAEQEGRKAREEMRLVLDTEMSVYKMATAAQIASNTSTGDSKKIDGNKAKNGSNPANSPNNSGAGASSKPQPGSEEAM